MSERGAVRFGESTIEFEVQRSQRRRKTVQITVDGGGVQVTAPVSTPADELRGIVRKRAAWIMRRSTAETLAAAPKRFVSGETLPYLGRNVRLLVEHADVRSVSVRFDHWRFRVTVPTGRPIVSEPAVPSAPSWPGIGGGQQTACQLAWSAGGRAWVTATGRAC